MARAQPSPGGGGGHTPREGPQPQQGLICLLGVCPAPSAPLLPSPPLCLAAIGAALESHAPFTATDRSLVLSPRSPLLSGVGARKQTKRRLGRACLAPWLSHPAQKGAVEGTIDHHQAERKQLNGDAIRGLFSPFQHN